MFLEIRKLYKPKLGWYFMSDLVKKYSGFNEGEGFSSTLSSIIDKTLSKTPRSRDHNIGLNTLISQDIYNKMYQGNFGRKVLIGEKQLDEKSGIVFDILLDYKNIIDLSDLIGKEDPIVLHYNHGDIEKPRSYFLKINEEYPEITKVFLGIKGNPLFFKLIGEGSRRFFVPASYLCLEEEK